MKNLKEKFLNFLKDEEGATAVEYAVMLVLIIVVAIGAVTLVGTGTQSAFQNVANTLSSAS